MVSTVPSSREIEMTLWWPTADSRGRYGQTGSGKSHTMVSTDRHAHDEKCLFTLQTGTDSELGIIPCAVDGVFDSINAVSAVPVRGRSSRIGTRPGISATCILYRNL